MAKRRHQSPLGVDDLDVEDSDTSNRADSGCSAAAGGRGEAGHPAENPRCAPPDRLHGAVRAAHHGPRSGGPSFTHMTRATRMAAQDKNMLVPMSTPVCAQPMPTGGSRAANVE